VYNPAFLASWSIPKKLLLLLLVILLPASGVLVVSGLAHRAYQIREAENKALLLVQSLAAQQEQIAIGTKQMLSTLALLSEVQELDALACNALFRELQNLYPFYSIISAATPDGSLFAASIPFVPGSVDLSSRKHFEEAMGTLDFSAGEFVLGRVSKIQTLHYSYPVLDADKNLVAVVSAGFKLDEYARFIEKANLPKGSAVAITDHKGVRLYRLPENDAVGPGKPIPEDSFKKISSGPEQGTYERMAADGIYRVYAFKQIRLRENSAPYLYMFVGTPKDKILHEANIEMLSELSILGIAAVLAMCLAWAFGNLVFIRPIKRLVGAARQFGRGEMGTRTGLPHTPDELGQLAESFDEMASLLELRDIERRHAEAALRESEEKFRALFESMAEGVALHEIIYDENGEAADYRIIAINSAFEAHTDLDREHCIGQPASKVYGTATAPYLEAYAQVAHSGTPCSFEAFFPPLNRHFHISVTSPKPGQFVTVFENITERRQAEESLHLTRFSIDHAADPVLWTGPRAQIFYANEAACRSLGYSRDELLSMSVPDIDPFFSTERWPDFYQHLKQAGFLAFESAHRRKDGVIFPIEVSVSNMTFNGKELNFVFVKDITERKKAEQERLTLEAQLNQAQKMEAIGTLAGGIAHDFNNILAAIIGYTEMSIIDASEQSQLRHDLEQILAAGHRARDLVKQILAFSRMKPEQIRQPINIGPVIHEALKFLRASIPSTIEIRQHIMDDDALALADPTQIHQVLTNLCTNAAHALEESGGMIEVGLDSVDLDPLSAPQFQELKPGPYLRLWVSDNGQGMSSATLQRIFDPYFTTKEHGKGTGLGLSVVHGIVKGHDGQITVYSEPGRGSVFHVYLPRIGDEARPREMDASPLPRGEERILLVDDEENLVSVERRMLESLGYHVTARTDSTEALELFRKSPDDFDLVITDYTMPKMTGLDLATEMIRIRPDLAVLLCSGYTERITQETAGGLGIREFLMKPLKMREMACAVRRVLDTKAPGSK
jgi:PAS domain S-box-containing protein